jgi:diguanylate cyclase (GGDEF)-like protein/PAS domain S-box-containing protein
MALVNVSEPLLAALMLQRWHPRETYFESGHGIACFSAVCLLAPLGSGLAGALCVTVVTGTAFTGNLLNWVLGHGLGMLTFTPLFILLLRGEFRHWSRISTAKQRLEGGLLFALVSLSCVAAFAQNAMPLGFLPMLALTLATFRLGRLGAAVSIIVVALVGGWFTLRGMGPTTYIQTAAATRVHFFQLYMAAAVLTILPVAADLKQRKRLYETLRDSEARFRLVTENSTDIILNLDPDGTIRYVSPAIATVGGYAPDSLVGEPAQKLVCEEDWGIAWAAHQAALRAPGRTITIDHRGLTAAGEMRWFETRSRAVLNDAGEPDGIVSSIRDITERKETEMRLTQAASTDPLTGLANRRGFEGRLHAMLERRGSRAGCLAVFDIDHFKLVNDGFGHAAGDAVIVAFAEMAQSITGSRDLVARLGGEEFGIILADVTQSEAQTLCDHLRQTVSETPVPTSSGEVRITVSAGLVDLRNGSDASTAFRAADAALYRAKAEGRDRLRLAADTQDRVPELPPQTASSLITPARISSMT